MENNGLSASDVALMNRDNFGGDAFMWIFALLILYGGGFGGGFGGWGNGTDAVLNADMQRGFDNQNAMANQREILAAVNAGTAQSVAATNQSFHDTLMANQSLYNEIQRDMAALGVGQANTLAQINACCCSTKQEIFQNRYDSAMNTAAINANTTAQTQKILDAIQQNKIESLQAKINELELKNATAGMLTFPNSWSFDAGKPPFCNCTTTTPTTGA